MLTNDFCTVLNLENLPGTAQASLQWNADHPIFLGHFPGQPVVPGVCMVQVLSELLATCLGIKVWLKESTQMKFLLMIDPRLSPVVDVKFNYTLGENGLYNVNASIQKEKDVYFKCNCLFAALITNEGEI